MRLFAVAATMMMIGTSGCLLTVTSGVTRSTGIQLTTGAESSGSGTAGATGSSSGGAGATATGTGTGPSIAAGPCSSNNQCVSGVCGVDGTGHCCNAACGNTLAPCGATDCDGQTGACLFPGAGVACGDQSCTGELLSRSSVCDGAGDCAPNTTSCTPYICGDNACLTTCKTNAQCAASFFCDAAEATCCPALTAGDTVHVDSVNGNDRNACCGIGSTEPCQTIFRTMHLIEAASAPDVIIRATVAGDGGTWAPPSDEVYPIRLGWGVELSAPGVYFFTDQENREIIDVTAFSANDQPGYASITGSTANPIWIGMDADGDQMTDGSAILVERGSTLYIANATVNANGTSKSCLSAETNAAITVNGDATLLLGQDHSAAVMGTVRIGGNGLLDGCIGIHCPPSFGTAAGCTIADADLGDASSVIIQGQKLIDIFAESLDSASNISLRSKPIIGAPPAQVGFGQCKSKRDGTAVFAWAPTHMTFDNATVQCVSGTGFYLPYDGPLPPAGASLTLSLNNTTIQNTDVGIHAEDGIATVTSSTIQFNDVGVYVDAEDSPGGAIDLSGAGADGGRNTVVCSSVVEATLPDGLLEEGPGISVLNTASQTLNASNVYWDTAAPDLFRCTPYATIPVAPCSCELSSCTTAAYADGMDAVYTGTGTITTTGSGLSPIICWPPDGG